MSSLYLNKLTATERDNLLASLVATQKNTCFICEEHIDLAVHKNAIDIDHVVPTKLGGKDDPANFAVTHSSCNRSKQASHLEVARILYRFEKLKNRISKENRGPNLDDILQEKGGGKYPIPASLGSESIKLAFPEIGQNSITELPVYKDDLSGFDYFFLKVPIEYVFHDDKINPRSIGQNISKLVQEFHSKRPQLHVALGWLDTHDGADSKIKIFDGQHKAAAQIMLGARTLPVRVFLNPDKDTLLTANTNAGTTLRQVAFDKSVQRHLGSALYWDRIHKYKTDCNLGEEDFSFSEKDLLKYFKGESREVKRYILDSVRDSITHNAENRLKDYIDFAGRGKERPLSYSTIEKTFYSFFIFQDVLDTPLSYKMDEGENPRELEKSQILNLMNIIADEIYIGKFEPDIGTNRIENRIQNGETLPLNHIKAFRLSKEEIMYNWLNYISQIISNFFIVQGKPIQQEKLFQYKFPDPLWEVLKIFVINMYNLPIWANNALSVTVFGGKQNYDYWQTVFESGKTPQGVAVLSAPINLMDMIQK